MSNIFELFALLSKHGATLNANGDMQWTAAGFAAFARDWENLMEKRRPAKEDKVAFRYAKPMGRPKGAKDKQPRKSRKTWLISAPKKRRGRPPKMANK